MHFANMGLREYSTPTTSHFRPFEIAVNIIVFAILFQVLQTSRTASTRVLHRGPVYLKRQYEQFSDPKRKQETDAIVNGYHIAIKECQTSFKWNKWNCTLPKALLDARKPISLTKNMQKANRETAYVYAMVAAGITYSLMHSCAKGENNRCPCIVEQTNSNRTKRTCKDNLEYALKRTKRFMRVMEVKGAPSLERKMFNTKNLKVGIKTVQKNLPEVCRCHGLSGTCQQSLCWKSMPNIGKVSGVLRKLYDNAVRVRLNGQDKALVPTDANQDKKKVKDSQIGKYDIVYLEKSPDYCKPNPLTGHRGTLHRYCDPDNSKICKNLCEDCGHRTVKRVVYERNCDKCRKQFMWCCNVICDKCSVSKAQCM